MTAITGSYLEKLEYLGEGTQFASTLHRMAPQSPILENLSLAEIRLLGHFMRAYRVQPGQTIITEGDPGDFMLVVVTGRIEVSRCDSREVSRVLAVVGPGKTVGEMSMLDGEPRFATCVAREPTTICIITRDSLAHVLTQQPMLGAKVLMELSLLLSQRLRFTSKRLVDYFDRQRELHDELQQHGLV